MIVQTFIHGVTHPMRSTIDVTVGGMLMNKTKDESYNLIGEMTLNTYKWSNERGQPKRVGDKLELNVITCQMLK